MPTLVEVEVPSLHSRAEGDISSHEISSRDDGSGGACEETIASPAARPRCHSALAARLVAAADEAEAVAAAAVAHAKALRIAADEAFAAGEECTASVGEEVVTPGYG